MRSAFLWIAGWLTAMPAAAQWLNLCGVHDPGEGSKDYLSHRDLGNGQFERLSLTESPEPGCGSVAVESTKDTVRWTRIFPQPDALRGVRQVILQGKRDDHGFHVSELIAPESQGPSYVGRKMVLPGFELLPKFTLETFGKEDRAAIDDKDPAMVNIDCAAGRQPAGLVLRVASSLPSRAALKLSLTAQGTGRFAIGYSDQPRHIAGDPIILGELELSSPHMARSLTLDLPNDPKIRADWRSLTLACPESGGQITLLGLRLEAESGLKPKPGRATWYWSTASWRLQSDSILAQHRDWKLRRIYIGVDFRDGAVADAQLLRQFVIKARDTGLEIWAVLGDPAAASPSGRRHYQDLVGALGHFNDLSTPESRLDGIQLDIEPYLEPAYQGQEEYWKSEYLTAVSGISASSRLPVEVVLPFWLDDPRFLAALVGSVQSVTVMDYRTDPLFITERALPFLEWGDTHGIRVFVALESAELQPEERHYYAAAAEGELQVFELAGRTILGLFDQTGRPESGQAYQLRSSVPVDFDRVTFFGRDQNLAAILPQLERQFSAWSSFAGIAIHGLHKKL